MELKSGIKTTEFWLTVILLGMAMAAFFLHRIDWQTAISFISVALGIGSYSISRSLTKGSSSLPPSAGAGLTLLVVGLISMSACAGWQTTARSSIAAVHESAKGISLISEPAFKDECMSRAQACVELKDRECKPLKECQTLRKEVNKALIGVHTAAYTALGAVSIADEKGFDAILKKAVQLIFDTKAMLQKGGIL